MNDQGETRDRCGVFSYCRVEEVALMRFRENMLLPSTDLKVRDQVLSCMESVSANPRIKVLVILSAPGARGKEEYLDIFERLRHGTLTMNTIHRLTNVFHQFVTAIAHSGKIVVHANCGRVITPLMNISLACDFRVVSSDTVFENPYLDVGLVPLGGGPFFLVRRLGMAAAWRVLLAREAMGAQEALDMGLVDRVVPPDELEDAALEKARELAALPGRTLGGLKRLVNFEMDGLEAFLELEHRTLIRCVEASGLAEAGLRAG